MPRRSQRTTKRRTVFKRIPGGATVKKVKGKTRGKPTCAGCGKELHGIPKNALKLSKSKRTVNRPYGGHYCSKCTRQKIIEKAESIKTK